MLLLSLAWVATVRPEILAPVSESVHVRSYVLAGGEDIPYKYAVAAVSFLCEKYPIIAYLHLYLSRLKKNLYSEKMSFDGIHQNFPIYVNINVVEFINLRSSKKTYNFTFILGRWF